MCMQCSGVAPYQKWRWAGDEIVYSPLVPAARTIPGHSQKYDVDIREYVGVEGCAAVRRELEKILDSLAEPERVLFLRGGRGCYDFRAYIIARWMSNYGRVNKQKDYWLFPEETIAVRKGDCEDMAFLLAALLGAAGISDYCLRVAFGRIQDRKSKKSYDHAWVVYHSEGGAWQILEHIPAKVKQTLAAADNYETPDVEYIPHYVFNRKHMWRVRSPDTAAASSFEDYVHRRGFWSSFDPTFAAAIHNDIFDLALPDIPDSDRSIMKAASVNLDANILGYDPRDHFDFGYVKESWDRIVARIKQKDVYDFGLAAHSAADFYAHTTYAMFAQASGDQLELYDHRNPQKLKCIYDFSPFDLPKCQKSRTEAEQYWRGKIVSGQWWRWYAPYPDDIQNDAELLPRFCLPDHDAIAVDGPSRPASHKMFGSTEYGRQYKLRKDAAVRHVRLLYEEGMR